MSFSQPQTTNFDYHLKFSKSLNIISGKFKEKDLGTQNFKQYQNVFGCFQILRNVMTAINDYINMHQLKEVKLYKIIPGLYIDQNNKKTNRQGKQVSKGYFLSDNCLLDVFHLNPQSKDFDIVKKKWKEISVPHPNIIKVVANIKRSSETLIFTEKIMDNLGEQSTADIGLEDKLRYLQDIARGLAYLNSMGFVHLNIKPASCYITQQKVCKLGRLECVRLLLDEKGSSETTLQPRNISPEIFSGKKIDKIKCNVWCFGLLIYEVITGNHLFHHASTAVALIKYHNQLKNGDLPFNIDNPQLKQLLYDILKSESGQRISISVIQERLSIIRKQIYEGFQTTQLNSSQFTECSLPE